MTSRSDRFAAWNEVREATGYRSGLEAEIAGTLQARGVNAAYEPVRIPYEIAAHAHYTADWVLREQAIVLEGKGQFTPGDRKKMLLVKQQHPDLDIRIIFSNPNNRLGKGSCTTYAMWCEKNNFPCCGVKRIPDDWFTHIPSPAARKALDDLLAAAS